MYTGIKEFNIEGVRRVKLKGRRRGRRERESAYMQEMQKYYSIPGML